MKQHFGNLMGLRMVPRSEPLVAWRSWLLRDLASSKRRWWSALATGTQVRLTSTWAGLVWPAAPSGANCLAADRCHGGLGRDCTCGIWGSKSLENLAAHGAAFVSPAGAIGRVALWGFVWEYEHGFRASTGQIKDVWLGGEGDVPWRDEMAQHYNVPVHHGMPDVEGVTLAMLIDSPAVRVGA